MWWCQGFASWGRVFRLETESLIHNFNKILMRVICKVWQGYLSSQIMIHIIYILISLTSNMSPFSPEFCFLCNHWQCQLFRCCIRVLSFLQQSFPSIQLHIWANFVCTWVSRMPTNSFISNKTFLHITSFLKIDFVSNKVCVSNKTCLIQNMLLLCCLWGLIFHDCIWLSLAS